jgi:hypothetical protein
MNICTVCGHSLKPNAMFCGQCGASIHDAGNYSPDPAKLRSTSLSTGYAAASIEPIGSNAPAQSIDLMGQWRAAHWVIRLVIVCVVMAVPVILLISSTTGGRDSGGAVVMGLILIPLALGAVIALAQPEPVLGWMDRFTIWAGRKRERSKSKGTFLARWFFRPLYASLSGSATVTRPISAPYLRAGVMVALQFFAVYMAMLIAYAAIIVVLAIVFIILMLWIISAILSGGFSGDSARDYAVRRVVRRSQRRTGILGDEYTQHFDSSGRKAGYTQERKDIFGRPYQQHFTQDGKKVRYTEDRQDLFGDHYQQHFSQDGKKSGYSEDRKDLFGDEYIQHFNEQDRKSGRSEVREDIFGDKYIKHSDD